MLRITALLTIVIFISSGHAGMENSKLSKTLPAQSATQKVDKVTSALKFINSYVENLDKLNGRVEMVEWVYASNLTTKTFKEELKRILDDAYKREPEIGLGFDPILDAQDNPDKGFEIESVNDKTNYLTVRGKDWPEFKLTMKVKEENGNWLVDGCGIINIPSDKKAMK